MALIATIWNIFLVFFSWWLIPIAFLFYLRKRWGKFPLEAVIIEKRGDNLIETNDRAGKMEKQGITYYQLVKAKDKIPVYNYDWIMHCNRSHTNLLERLVNLLRPTIGCIFLFKYGSKQYKPININNSDKNKQQFKKVKNEAGEEIYQYQYAQFDPRWVVGALDFDVIDWDNMNFIVQEQRASIMRRQRKRDMWLQIGIPIMIIAACLIAGIFILKFSSDAGVALRGGAGNPQSDGVGGSKLMGGIQDAFTPGS